MPFKGGGSKHFLCFVELAHYMVFIRVFSEVMFVQIICQQLDFSFLALNPSLTQVVNFL